MKLPNGYGTVYKLPGNRRKPWIARKTIGFKEVISKKTGKKRLQQIYQTIGYFEKPKDALDALAKHRFNPVSQKANITLEELYNEWSKFAFKDLSYQTEDNYKAGWNYLSKYKKVQFKELRTAHFQEIIDGCKEAGKSKSTVQKIKIVISLLYKYAMENDICNKNYAKFIKIPKFEKKEREPFSDLEIKKIEDSVDTIEWADTIMILIYTGLRISEMLLLTKFSIDWDNQTLTGGIKTEAGRDRVIPIHPKLLPIIKKWYDKDGPRLIFHKNNKGKDASISAKKYRNDYYKPTLQAIGVRELTPHSCRHTCATLLAKAGADPLAIQKILGHASYSTTADIYTHTDIVELKKAMNMI